MSLYDLIISRRSIRQFKQEPVSRDILQKFINASRLAPSAANRQPLEFVVVDEEKIRKEVFTCLKWAAYIAPEGNPKPGHEPVAYIVVLVNSEIREKGFEWDVGAAIENMILAALEKGIGSCWLLSVDREKLREILNIPENYKIDSVLALGYPDENPVIEDMKDSIKYWKDQAGQLHVPKRKLEDVIHFNKF
ncbi:MAG: nitroreductase family protein [Candidatus Aminicenantes bacterium]|nr:nitroreductase family protein [Candidatus Aminicenantes bacterium]